MAMRWRLCLCSLGILLLASCTLSEKFSLSGSSRPVVGIVGQDVVLPCQLSPAARLPRMDLWWRKIGTGFIPVHEYLDEGPTEQAGEGYENRTELFRQEFSNGNVSLKLKQLRVADGGTYHCFVRNPQWSQEATTELQVAAVAPVFIGILGPQGQGIRLVCRSTGWFPKPELRWVGKNQLNQAMESVTNMTQDRENLYSVVSHVTVIEEDSGDISCIVRNGLLETEQQLAIHLSSEVFPRASPWLAAFWALFVLVLVAAGVCAYCEYTAKQKASQKKSAEQKTFEAEKKALLSDKSKLQENFVAETKAFKSELQELSQKLDVKIKDFESERQQLSQTIEFHRKENEKLTAERSKLQKDLESQKKANELLTTENSELQKDLESQKKANEQLTTENSKLQKELKSERKENEKLTKDKSELQEKLKSQKKDNEKLTTECRELRQRLDAKENELQLQSVIAQHEKKPQQSETAQHEKPLQSDMAATELGFRQARSHMVPVTLDPECKHPELIISEDGRTVWHKPSSTRPLGSYMPFVAVGREGCVVRRDHGGEGGVCRWYWEVEVGDSLYWELGVLSESVRRRLILGRLVRVLEEGCWALKRLSGQYHPSEANTVIQSWAVKPTVVGVFLDLERGSLSFYNVSSMSLILEIPVGSSERLFPFLSPGRTAGGAQGKPLRICPPQRQQFP